MEIIGEENDHLSGYFNHEDLIVYRASVQFVTWSDDLCHCISEKACALDHLTRAAASLPSNIAQGNGKSSALQRCSFFDVAYGSALECAACLDVLFVKRLVSDRSAAEGKSQLFDMVSMLIGLRKTTESAAQVRESGVPYQVERGRGVKKRFDHETLRVYQISLRHVAWCAGFACEHGLAPATVTILDKTATSIVLHIAEGNGKFSKKDRCRFIEYARTAVFQAAPALDILCARRSDLTAAVNEGKTQLSSIVSMLFAWEKSLMA